MFGSVVIWPLVSAESVAGALVLSKPPRLMSGRKSVAVTVGGTGVFVGVLIGVFVGVAVAGLASTLPALSTARTRKVWTPKPKPL